MPSSACWRSVSCSPPRPPGPRPRTVDEIVAKNLAARGGLDKLRGLQTMKMTGTINVQGMDMPLTVMTKRPNLLFQEMTMQGQRMVSAFDGAKVWAINPMLGSRAAGIDRRAGRR